MIAIKLPNTNAFMYHRFVHSIRKSSSGDQWHTKKRSRVRSGTDDDQETINIPTTLQTSGITNE